MSTVYDIAFRDKQRGWILTALDGERFLVSRWNGRAADDAEVRPRIDVGVILGDNRSKEELR